MSLTIPLFSLTQLIYWLVLYYPSGEPSVAAVVVKCLPVASLAFSIFLDIETNEPLKEEGSKVNSTFPYIINDHTVYPITTGFSLTTCTFQNVPGWEWKRLKGCVFSPPFLLPVLGGQKEVRKRYLSIASIPVCLLES